MSDTDLVVVRTYLNQFEADIVRSALEAAGIQSFLKSDDCGGMRPHMWMGGIQLLVRSEDVIQASEVIDSAAAAVDEDVTDRGGSDDEQ